MDHLTTTGRFCKCGRELLLQKGADLVPDLEICYHCKNPSELCHCPDCGRQPVAAQMLGGASSPATLVHELAKPAYNDGANCMLESVRASLRDYPNVGGDTEVMAEVERIANEAVARYISVRNS